MKTDKYLHVIPLDRDEFSSDFRMPEALDHHLVRNSWEHPEAAYRRGAQQGAHEVRQALKDAGVLDDATAEVLDKYVDETLATWRFFKRPLKREFPRDRIPHLEEKLSAPHAARPSRTPASVSTNRGARP